MSNILQIMKKDLKEYYRESMTFRIVILSPILIILIFSLIFSRGIPSTINLPMKIAVCSGDDSLPTGFINNLKEEKWVQVEEISGDCDNLVMKGVSSGIYKGGISIPQNFTDSVISGDTSNINVYVDNSLIAVDSIMKGYLWRVIQKYSDSFNEEPTASVTGEFLNLSHRLKDIKNSISLAAPIQSFKSGAQELNSDLKNVDTKAYGGEISAIRSRLQSAKDQINSTYEEIGEFRRNIGSYKAELVEVKSDLIEYDNMTMGTKLALEALYNSTCNTGGPLFPDTLEACDQLSSSIDELNAAHNDLQQKIHSIDSMISELSQADEDLASRQAMLLQMGYDIDSSQVSLNAFGNSITYLEGIKNKASSFTSQIDSFSTNASREEDSMKSELSSFNSNINEMLMGMSILPLNPIQIETKNAFEGMKFLDFVMPSLMAMLIMFAALFLSSTTIINEKNSGTLTRNMLTPMTLTSFMIGKLMSIILVGLTELSVMLIVGSLIFGIYVPSMIVQLAACIVLSMFAFSVIGMLIGIWSDSGITAVLIVVTLMIVLLFISGLIIPSELLPQDVVQVGSLLPLSNVFSLLKGMFVYGTIDQGAMTYLLAISIVGTIACIFSIKRQVR